MKKIFLIFRLLLKTHYPIKTIWINFKCLPFRQAIHLPIFLYSKTIFRSLTGKIIIDCDKISTNMIKIGANWWYPATAIPQTIWSINGDLIFKGPISFPQGTYIMVADKAMLQFGTNGTMIGTNTKVICFEKIVLGDSARITWDCQVYDTSFHYVEIDGRVGKLTAPVIIGNNVWVGNGTTITKGSVLLDWTIVANGSFVNKNLQENGEHCFYAGSPAVLKKKAVTRIFDENRQAELDKQYNYHRNQL